MSWPPTVVPVTARELVRRLIASNVPEFGNRVYENDLPVPGTQTPYAVVRMGNDSVITNWGAKAVPVTVWPFIGMNDDKVSYRLLDLLNSKIVAVLTPNGESALIDEAAAMSTAVQQTPGVLGNRYFVTYTGVSVQDTRDETLQAITRPVEFSVSTLVWRPEESNAFITALSLATAAALPSAQTNPQLSAPTDVHPFVYWRWSQMPVPVDQLTLDAWWEEGTVVGHVLTPNPNTRIDAIGQVTRAFSPNIVDGWHVLHTANGWPIQVIVTLADATADAMTAGQITLRCRTTNADGDPAQWYGEPDGYTSPPSQPPIVFGPDAPPWVVSDQPPNVDPTAPPGSGGQAPGLDWPYPRIRRVLLTTPMDAEVNGT